MSFYKIGELRQRPGVYIRIINRGKYVEAAPGAPPTPPTPPGEAEGIMVFYDNGVVTISIPGCTVTSDGNGTVMLSGLPAPVVCDDNGNVMIGG